MSEAMTFNSGLNLDLDLDEWYGDSPPANHDPNDDASHAHIFGGANEGKDNKGHLGPLSPASAKAHGLLMTSPESTISSFQDSLSDSSKKTQSSVSTKPECAGGDTTMTDGLELKPGFDFGEFIHTDNDDQAIRFDGTIDPQSIQQAFGSLEETSDDRPFTFGSGSTSPDPSFFTKTPNLSTVQTDTVVEAPPPTVIAPAKRHSKAFSQYSLTQSMSGLKTNVSREVSPSDNFVFSQDSSPSAYFNNSPSPGMTIDFKPDPTLFPHRLSYGNIGTAGLQPNALPVSFMGSGIQNGPTGSASFPVFQQPLLPQNYQLHINKIALKSRVETQINIKMTLRPLPPGVTRLHLPAHTISKPKLLARPRAERAPDLLELYVSLVCTSAMQDEKKRLRALTRAAATGYADLTGNDDDDKGIDGGEVRICAGCMQRERKRADRKKSKKPDEEETWKQDEHKRVIVFNTSEVKDWQEPNAVSHGANGQPLVVGGTIDAPMRIACYCRHHGEKSGFQVIFTIKDCHNNLIAQAMSDSIMITDDHKTHGLPSISGGSVAQHESGPSVVPNNSVHDSNSLSPGAAFRGSHSTSDLTSLKRQSGPYPNLIPGACQPHMTSNALARNLSRPASPNSFSGPIAKKRKSSGSKVPNELAMTRMENMAATSPQNPTAQNNAALSAATSPFSPNPPPFATAVQEQPPLFATAPAGAHQSIQPFSQGPPTPNSNNDQAFFPSSRPSMDNLAMGPIFSAPTSTRPSRAASPSGLRTPGGAIQQQAQFAQNLQNSLYSLPLTMAPASSPAPTIHRIIPGEGSKTGGYDVTILGIGFYQGLDVMFGDQKATTTTFWGERSLVALVPPSATSTVVPVTLRQPNGQALPGSQQRMMPFKYLDDDESQLLRTALAVLAKKMNGKFLDAQDMARRIIGGDNDNWGNADGGQTGGSGGNYHNFTSHHVNFEAQILKLFDFIDLDDSPSKVRWGLQRRQTGQCMLHLACSLGLHRVVAGLLARGANPDVRDHGGYTPMHLAALSKHPEIVRRLVCAGADPTLRTLSGLTAAEVAAGSREVLHAMRRVERHARSRSGCSLPSRASSVTSLKSLWEPSSDQVVETEYKSEDSGAESPEYSQLATSEDDDDDDDDEQSSSEDAEWLDMRRGSTHTRRPQEFAPPPLVPTSSNEVAPALPHPALATVAAMRDQLAHLQHFVSHSLSMPPNTLMDYYLNSAPLQRISALMPNIGVGSRAAPGDDSTGGKEAEGRWWDFSLFMNPGNPTPPPAYEEIFPQKDVDTKQASAAAAAAEAEADAKCQVLYDDKPKVAEASDLAESSTSTSDEKASSSAAEAGAENRELPALLEIGRKHNITIEQQANLRRAHAEQKKEIWSDKKLLFIWIPILLVVLIATFLGRYPGMVIESGSFSLDTLQTAARNIPTNIANNVVNVVRNAQDRLVEGL